MFEVSKYHKINSVWKRDSERNMVIIEGEYSSPEFQLLANCAWEWTEKIDGTNIRIGWNGNEAVFKGRTDKAQIPKHLLDYLKIIFTPNKLKGCFATTDESVVALYGEGYGHKIQKAGSLYLGNNVGFILFDVRIGHIWLRRSDVENIAVMLGIPTVPFVGCFSVAKACDMCREPFASAIGEAMAEGLVGRAPLGLLNRAAHRIITKVKVSDYRKLKDLNNEPT